jgi:hypothetical protein
MAVAKTRSTFFETEEGKKIQLELQEMFSSNLYNTAASYSANNALYPDNLIPFVDKHMNFLITHPSVKASTYLANVKLMTKVR